MEWLNKMKERYSKKRIEDLGRVPFKRDFVDLESARTIGIILNTNESSIEDLTQITSYADTLKKRGKKILIIEINYDKKSTPSFNSALFINPNKLNWYDYPIPSLEKEIQDYDLDILMNFDSSVRLTSKYVCSIAKAKTRTGVHAEGFESCYELMIALSNQEPETKMKSMIKEFDYFLNMIDK
ncbi:MAG: hypothetical protein AAF824_17520 [Bacteroidota bacterium]